MTAVRKGRGFSKQQASGRMEIEGFETFGDRSHSTYQRSVEGWILCVTNIHEETQEDTLIDRLAEFGQVQNIHMNLDRRTGFVKGYALAEFKTLEEAQAAKDGVNGTLLYDKEISCDFAFLRRPLGMTNN
jgi:RNA-binding protein 8A